MSSKTFTFAVTVQCEGAGVDTGVATANAVGRALADLGHWNGPGYTATVILVEPLDGANDPDAPAPTTLAELERWHKLAHGLLTEELEVLHEKLNRRVTTLPISIRAENALFYQKITYVGQLVQKTEADLRRVRNLGNKSIREIKDALADLNLRLEMHITGWQAPEAPAQEAKT